MAEERPTRAENARGRFLRRRTWPCRLLALPFLVACVGIAVVAGIYRWPTANLLVSTLAPVPPLVCLFALLPGLCAGIPAVRRVWLVLGFAAWLGAVVALEECLQWLKPFPGRARREFALKRARHEQGLDSGAWAEGGPTLPLRLVSWNLHHDRGLSDLGIEQVAGLDPDLLFLQECEAGALRDTLMRTGCFRGYFVDGSENSIVSRFPLVRVPNAKLPAWRGTVWAVEAAPGVTLYCINVHMGRYLLTPNLLRHWRPGQVRMAAASTRMRLGDLAADILLWQRRGPVILAGDFNVPAHYPDLRRATGSLKDCFAANGYGWGKTVRADLPVLRIDMIFVPLGARVYYTAAVTGQGSDHRMVLAEVAIPLAGTGAATAERRSAPAPSSLHGPLQWAGLLSDCQALAAW